MVYTGNGSTARLAARAGDFTHRPASLDDIATIVKLLDGANLPHSDVAQHIRDFILAIGGNQVAGVIGLEVHGRVGLLRSLAVDASLRKQGIGNRLCQKLVEHAVQRGVRDLYVLTLDAEAYFALRGFRCIDRSLAPAEIRATRQFSSLCPNTAILLVRSLGTGATTIG
ncbi:MAG: arsenic resistance N-acetyltransferase ArsN2 [Acidiferrobacterales bacterium]